MDIRKKLFIAQLMN